MKKILLTVGLFSLVLVGRSQTVLNEAYVDPGAGKSEFIELYNSSTSLTPQNLDCFTIVTYYENGATQGVYVLDLPNITVASKGFCVLAASNPFNVQAQTGVAAQVNWNGGAALEAAGGYLHSYTLNGASWNAPTSPANVTDLLYAFSSQGSRWLVLLYQNGALINGFIGGHPNGGPLPTKITSLPTLAGIPISGSCAGTPFSINFSTLPVIEYVNQAPGNDNGYARKSDGKCGAWDKTAPGVSHTPGVTNGSATTATSSLTTTQVIQCGIPAQKSTLNFDITAIVGTEITEAADFPVIGQVYADRGTGGQLDGLDSLLGEVTFNTVAEAGKTVVIPQTVNLMVVYKTKRGCFDKVISVTNTCAPLPVGLLNFSASRNMDAIVLRWATAFEQNNSGFEIERNVNGSWEKIGFVASQALNGNSGSDLSYSFVDRNNNNKGITQYRLRQIDIDAKATYSDVRAVRGDGQIGKITIYPNPTADGKVNILFDDANVVRTVSISDMSGRTVKEIKSISNNNITITNLQPGMYTVKIAVPATGEQAVQKIVVNKR